MGNEMCGRHLKCALLEQGWKMLIDVPYKLIFFLWMFKYVFFIKDDPVIAVSYLSPKKVKGFNGTFSFFHYAEEPALQSFSITKNNSISL